MSFNQNTQKSISRLDISDNLPGPVLSDFGKYLSQVVHQPVPLTKGKKQPTQKWAAALDNLLSHPSSLTLKRPKPQHYPSVLGLYLLSRATGLCRIVNPASNSAKLEVNHTMMAQWQQMNAPEQYFNLLDAWLTRGHASIIGEQLTSSDDRFLGCCGAGHLRNDIFSGKTLNELWLEYLPQHSGSYNLALLQLFGLATLAFTNNNIHLSCFQLTPFGVDILNACQSTASIQGHEVPIGCIEGLYEDGLLPFIQHCRSDIHKALELPQEKASAGYLLKVFLPAYNVERTLAISSGHTFEELAEAIIAAFSFDDDHLYCFVCKNAYGINIEIGHSFMDECDDFADESCLKDYPPTIDEPIYFVYDFGDQWKFTLSVVDTLNIAPKNITVTDTQGTAPEQYSETNELL